jgi:uncharacterized protein
LSRSSPTTKTSFEAHTQRELRAGETCDHPVSIFERTKILRFKVFESTREMVTIPNFVQVEPAREHVNVLGPSLNDDSSGLCHLPTDRGSVLLVDDPMAIRLQPEPIKSDWILSGTPKATAKMVYRSRDWLQSIVIWECTPGRFNWHYNKDEVLFIVSGRAVLTNERGEKRGFGPGDTVFFPAGVTCTWLVEDCLRKVAVLREPVLWPLGAFLKAWAKLLRIAGLAGKFSL